MFEWLLPVFGFLIGIFAALTGIGGGAFIVPLLVLIYSLETDNAIGTSLAAILFTAIASTLNYSRQKRIYYRTGLLLAVATVPGALLGSYLTEIIRAKLLGLILGALLIPIAIIIMVDPATRLQKRSTANGKHPQTDTKTDSELINSKRTLLLGLPLSFFGGLASGLLGIGGGMLVVPILTLAIGMPIHIATATSMFNMIFTATSGVTMHFLENHITFEIAAFLGLGTVLGAQVGAYASKRISHRSLRYVFGIMLIVAALQIVQKNLTF